MADNIILNLGSGGDLLAADDDGTAKHQQVKIEFGTDGTFTPVTASVGLPVQVLSTAAVTQSGTFTVQPGNTANTTRRLARAHRSATPISAPYADTRTSCNRPIWPM